MIACFNKDDYLLEIKDWNQLIQSFLHDLRLDQNSCDLITDLNLHGPHSEKCCIINSKCKHHFPKLFENVIQLNKNRNTVMKCPNDYFCFRKKIKFDNQRVANYNPFLTNANVMLMLKI